MADCPNRTIDKLTMKCTLLPGMILVAPPHKLNRCAECEGQWRDGEPPTEETLTPTLHQIRQEQSLPSLLTMAGNAAKAGAVAIVNGAQQVSEEEQAKRLEICRSNECGYYLPPAEGKAQNTERCRQCGCYNNLKSRLAAWHCPVGRW